MILIKSIAIKNPCDQLWQQMTETNSGRYCDHCCKTVVDFTKMTNDEIVNYLSSNDSVCGRFDNLQLCYLNQSLNHAKYGFLHWKSWGLAAMIFGFSQHVKADTKFAFKVEQIPFKSKHSSIADSAKLIMGRIIDQEDGNVIQGASITLKGTNKEVLTDANGIFNITVRSNSDTLVAKFVGYKSKEIRVSDLNTSNTDVILQTESVPCTVTLGGVIVVRRPLCTRLWYKLKYTIHSVFQ